MDIGAWLRELGLERYEKAFHDSAIDAEILPNISAEDLRDIGVTSVGHRRKLLGAVARLKNLSTSVEGELTDQDGARSLSEKSEGGGRGGWGVI